VVTTAEAFVEVNDCAILMCGSTEATTWWHLYRTRAEQAGRVETLAEGIGDLIRITCADRAEAEWLAGQMVEHGIPAAAVSTNAPIARKLRTASRRPRRFE
jgi:hypothetical protein